MECITSNNCLKEANLDTAYYSYDDFEHNCNARKNTEEDGWIDMAVSFWKDYVD